MGNLCSIFHADFDRLVSLTGSHNKAVCLDKIVYWWQISTYTLGDNKIWFTRKISDIARNTCLSERTVSRYLDAFEKSGLLERTSKLSSSNRGGAFSVTKKLYIRVTEKLLDILSLGDMHREKTGAPDDGSLFLAQDGNIDNARMASSSLKDKYYNPVVNSTVSDACLVDNVENQKFPTQETRDNASEFPVEPMIGERVTERLRNYIKGMLKNVQGQYRLDFSDPDRLFAEVIFSVTQEQQWSGIANPHHRVNIIAKLLRQKQWKTPKGFYNHWDVGHYFRKKDSRRMEKEQKMKFEESLHATDAHGHNRADDMHRRFEGRLQDEYRYSGDTWQANALQEKLTSAMNQLCMELHSAERRLAEVEAGLGKGKAGFTKALVDAEAIRVAGLMEKRQALAEEIKAHALQAA